MILSSFSDDALQFAVDARARVTGSCRWAAAAPCAFPQGCPPNVGENLVADHGALWLSFGRATGPGSGGGRAGAHLRDAVDLQALGEPLAAAPYGCWRPPSPQTHFAWRAHPSAHGARPPWRSRGATVLSASRRERARHVPHHIQVDVLKGRARLRIGPKAHGGIPPLRVSWPGGPAHLQSNASSLSNCRPMLKIQDRREVCAACEAIPLPSAEN